jgi:PAS domain S-box-containing protein
LRAEEALRDEVSRRRLLVEQSRDGIVLMDVEGRVVESNLQFAHMLGYSMEEMSSLAVSDWEVAHSEEEVRAMFAMVDTTGQKLVSRHRRKDGTFYEVEISANGAVFGGRKYILAVCRDISEAKRAEREREALIRELQEALTEIKALRGILPLCSYCKKIRDDQGYWEQVDVYIRKHSRADVSHGICPDCAKKFFPELRAREE